MSSFRRLCYGRGMADDTLRQEALRAAVALAERCEDDAFNECDVVMLAARVVAAAEMIRAWLAAPNPAVRLALSVGPVTEQPS